MVKSGALPEDVEALLAFGLDLWSRLLATSYFATQKKLASTLLASLALACAKANFRQVQKLPSKRKI